MSQSTHTPGPWHFGEGLPGKADWPAGVGAQGYAPLCKMMGAEAEDVANARLISAAPDLLAACIHVIGCIENADGDMEPIVRAAIAKATGGAF